MSDAAERLERTLHAYCDGELGWWGRARFEARLRRSPELRRRVEALGELSALVRASQPPVRSPEIWPAIAGALREEDARIATEGPRSPRRLSRPWVPLGAAAAAAAAVVAVLVLSRGASRAPAPVSVAAGSVRFLDTGGAPVIVQDREEVTIIWLMDAGNDQV
jgi:anti-sigma factor RsiW